MYKIIDSILRQNMTKKCNTKSWLTVLFIIVQFESQFQVVKSRPVRRKNGRRQFLPSFTLPVFTASIEEGPMRNENYDPTVGYEPYWANGSWVLDNKAWGQYAIKNNISTTAGPLCPDVECPKMYERFGKLCGVNKYDKKKTFENYCFLLEEDCIGRYNWMISYRGACKTPYEYILYPVRGIEKKAHTYIMLYYNSTILSTLKDYYIYDYTKATRPGEITQARFVPVVPPKPQS